MLRIFLVLILFCAGCSASIAESPSCTPGGEARVSIAYPRAQLGDIVKLYRTLSKRKTWIDADLRLERTIDVASRSNVSVEEALGLIRDALRRKGIEIREVGDSEAYVSRVAQ